MYFFNDWIDENSIDYAPLIYIEGDRFYPSRKPLQDLFSKFSTSLEELRSSLNSSIFARSSLSRIVEQL